MNCNTTHYRANSSSVPGDPTSDPTQLDIERHLLTWEEAHRSGPIEVGYYDLADRAIDADALILLPTGVSWEALAHMGFFGAEAHRAGPMVAVVRTWGERYGAEVRTIWGAGTWMDFVVSRPPHDLDTAFELAVEQMAVGECTVEQITGASGLRGLARALQDSPTWALWERP